MKFVQRVVAGRGAWAILIPILVVLGLLLDRERSSGGVAWTLLTAYGMYRFGLWLAGPHLLPIEPNREARANARRVLMRFAGGHTLAMAVVREGKVLPGPDGKPRGLLSGEGVIFVDSTSVVVLATDTRPTRVLEPGVHFMRADEKIGAVVDLRVQARAQEVLTQTRDGIWVRFKVKARFQIDGTTAQKVQDSGLGRTRWPAPYKWSPRQVMRALGLERVGIDQKQSMRWDESVLGEAVKRVHALIAEYTFDKLTEPRDPRLNPREDIRRKLEDEVKAAMEGKGIKVLVVGLSQFAPRDKEVDAQRIEAWKADWVRRARIAEAEGLAERYRLIEMARAQGQMELVTRITQALEASQQLGSENADLIALRLLEVVERLAAQPEVDRRLSGESRIALSQAHVKLLEKGSPGEAAASP